MKRKNRKTEGQLTVFFRKRMTDLGLRLHTGTRVDGFCKNE